MGREKRRILLVEDEQSLREAFQDALQREGYVVRGAADGEEGLRLAQEKDAPDLIILDLVLPKKSGFEVLQELQSSVTTRRIPVVVLTNLEGSEDIERALAQGATTYLVKANYSLEDIVEKVKSLLKPHTFVEQ